MAAIIGKLDAHPSVYKTTMKTGNTSNGNIAETVYTKDSNGVGQRYNYTITINSDYLNTANRLSRAATIMHEMIHAYFLTLIDDNALGTNPNALEPFPVLFQAYVTKTFGPNTGLAQHAVIADKYVDVLARALQEFQTGTAVPDGVQPNQIYKDLAWGGLRDTQAFQSLSTVDKERINKRSAVEAENSPRGTMNPIGNSCK